MMSERLRYLAKIRTLLQLPSILKCNWIPRSSFYLSLCIAQRLAGSRSGRNTNRQGNDNSRHSSYKSIPCYKGRSQSSDHYYCNETKTCLQ